MYGYYLQRSNAEQRNDLINQLIEKEKTIQINEDIYQRSTMQLQNLLTETANYSKKLAAELDKEHQKVVTLTEVSAYWKHAYEGLVNATQDPPDNTDVPPECVDSCTKIRTTVNFDKNFGYIKVSGHTITNPPEGYVKIEQVRPLKLTIALSQGSDGRWKTTVKSSEDNVGVDVGFSAIDTYHFKEKWYEKIDLVGSIGIGERAVGSISALYGLGNFALGPMVGTSTDGSSAETFYGMTVSWRPFKK